MTQDDGAPGDASGAGWPDATGAAGGEGAAGAGEGAARGGEARGSEAGAGEAGAGEAGGGEAGGGEVSLEVVIDDEGHSGRGRLTVLRLRWLPSDPLAVGLHLSAQPEHPALPRGTWVVLRDFLRYGLEEPTGDGAVRIRPDELRDRVWFELDRYGRPACISLDRERLRDFLDRTEQAVPSGDERSRQALEELLERLLPPAP